MATVTLKTVTPIWTGGVTAQCDRVHETGILGSMRWWYAALVRGVGGRVKDPRDEYTPDDPCEVSRIFGATGWRRAFNLRSDDAGMAFDTVEGHKYANRRYTRRNGKTVTPFWCFGKGRTGDLSLQLIPMRSDFDPLIILGLLQFMAKWGSIGARNQLGYGWFKMPPESESGRGALVTHLQSVRGTASYADMPALTNMFFATVTVPSSDLRAMLDLKYDLRREFSTDSAARHCIFGTVRGERVASKVNTSRPLTDNTIRVWGWLPQHVTPTMPRSSAMSVIYGCLNSSPYTISMWREYGAPARDTSGYVYADSMDFLTKLAQEKNP